VNVAYSHNISEGLFIPTVSWTETMRTLETLQVLMFQTTVNDVIMPRPKNQTNNSCQNTPIHNTPMTSVINDITI